MAGGAGSRFSPLMASILECDQKIVSRGDSQKETMAICRIYVPEALSRSLFAVAFRLGAPHCSMSGFSNRPGSAVRLQGSRNQYIDLSLRRTFSRFLIAITCLARLTVSRFRTESDDLSISVKNSSRSANVVAEHSWLVDQSSKKR
jgi:hypothetical protein